MLSFDEFKAINNREKLKASALNEKTNTSPAIPKPTLQESQNADSSQPEKDIISPPQSKRTIGDFLELHSMQIFYSMLLLLDTFAAFTEIYLTSTYDQGQILLYSKFLRSFLKFTSIIFSLEIFLVYIAFGLSSLQHFGYILDLLVLVSQLLLDYYGAGSENRLLNILRVWRPMRLTDSMVSAEKDVQNILKDQLDKKEENIKKLEMKLESLQSEIEKEKSAKQSIESMLLNYKEEVDTLNEALKIAAMDIAEVAQAEDDLFTSEDEDDIDGEDTIEKSNASSTYKNKTDILRSALAEQDEYISDSKSTFIIHEDGKFERK